jgi:hypothetical protein
MTNIPVLVQRVVFGLVVGLPLTVLVYAVVMGGAALLTQLGDDSGALALRWCGTTLALLFVTGLVLLVMLLGYQQITRDSEEL